MTGTYPNCYPIPPATQSVCPPGMTGTPPNNCYPPPPDNDGDDGNNDDEREKEAERKRKAAETEPEETEPDSTDTDSTEPDSTDTDSTEPDSTDAGTGTGTGTGTRTGTGTGTGTGSKDPCGDWASATRDALHTYGSDGVPNVTPPPAGCGTTALQLARFLNRLTTSDPLDQVVLSAAESEAMRNALDALGSAYNEYITAWDSLTAAEKVLVASTACLVGGFVVSPPAVNVLGPGCTAAVGLADAWLPRPTVEPDGDIPGDDSSEQDRSDQKNINKAKDQNGGDSDKFSDAAYTEALEDFDKTGDLGALTDFLNEWVCHHGDGTPTTGTCE